LLRIDRRRALPPSNRASARSIDSRPTLYYRPRSDFDSSQNAKEGAAMASAQDLMYQSGFVFEGTVEQLGASTSSGYPATAETAIVRVNRLVKSTPALSGFQGQLVTVHLQAPVSLQAGQQATFFTHGIHYGDGLVVNELGIIQPQPAAAPAPDLATVLQSSIDAEMTHRLAQADLVVSGVASAPRRMTPPPTLTGAAPARRVSEHDPDWWVVTITIDAVEKGVHTAKTKDVLFANSTDVTWARSPKVKQGDRGVWLMHLTDVYGRPVPAHAATHPLDYRPADDVARVRRLVT
jgi:hypothetical protein